MGRHREPFCGRIRARTTGRWSELATPSSRPSAQAAKYDTSPQNAVVGYFTLANDAIALNTSEQAELGLPDEVVLTAFPAVKLGRFAVAQGLQGEGVGDQILELVIGEILDAESLSAARLVIVDADNDPRVLRFYERHRFERSLWAEKQARNHGGRSPPAAIKMVRDILRTL